VRYDPRSATTTTVDPGSARPPPAATPTGTPTAAPTATGSPKSRASPSPPAAPPTRPTSPTTTGQPVALRTSTGTEGLYVYDGRNNPVGLVTDFNAVAYLYNFDPYGTSTTTTNSGGTGYPQNPYVFAGGLQDRATGLIRYGARWYNPTTGTWTQQDTLNAPLDPANANRYTYVGGDPINGTDPTGLCSGVYDCGGKGGYIGTLAGGVVGGLVGGLASGGIGAIPGAALGAGEGAFAGAVIGGVVGLATDIF